MKYTELVEATEKLILLMKTHGVDVLKTGEIEIHRPIENDAPQELEETDPNAAEDDILFHST